MFVMFVTLETSQLEMPGWLKASALENVPANVDGIELNIVTRLVSQSSGWLKADA